MKKKMSYSTEQVIEILTERKVSNEAKSDFINEYIPLVIRSSDIASKKTHYDRLNEWRNPLYEFVDAMMHKYGFVNGNVKATEEKPDACFWWEVHRMISSVIYSPNLKTKTESHHSSAYERNEALKIELQFIVDEINKKEK